MKKSKMYPVSKTLDVEVDYFVTKIDNARFDAQEENDFDRLDILEEKFVKLIDLQQNLVFKDNCFYVSGAHYELANECKNAYRFNH